MEYVWNNHKLQILYPNYYELFDRREIVNLYNCDAMFTLTYTKH